MFRCTSWFMMIAIGMLLASLTACGATTAPASTAVPGAASSAVPALPLRNDLISGFNLVGKPGVFQAPWDATPDPEGTTVYFTADSGQGAGVFKVPFGGGDTSAVVTGAPFVAPRGLATSSDGQQIYVADEQASVLFAVPAVGGPPMPLMATQGTAPQNVTVVAENGSDVIYFSGKNPKDDQPAVLKWSGPQNGTLAVVAKGAPLVAPSGIAITGKGTLYVADRLASGNDLGAVFRIENGSVTKVADNFRSGVPVAGVSLLMDDSLLLVSALARDRDSAQVLVIDLASGQQGLVTKVIEANTGAGGLHRAYKHNLFAWSDSPHNKSRSGGGVYAIKP